MWKVVLLVGVLFWARVDATDTSGHIAENTNADPWRRFGVNIQYDGSEAVDDTTETSCVTQTSTNFWVNLTTFRGELAGFEGADYLTLTEESAWEANGNVNGSSFSLRYCTGVGCGAFGRLAYAGAYCSGTFCAGAGWGPFTGFACMGVNCSAYARSGCPVTNSADGTCDPTDIHVGDRCTYTH